MIRTLAVALGLAVAASSVAAEEFVVIVNDLFDEAGAATGVTSVPDAPAVVPGTPDETLALIERARGEDGTFLDITPFN